MKKARESVRKKVEAELKEMIDRLDGEATVVVGKSGITAAELTKMCAGGKNASLKKSLLTKMVNSKIERAVAFLEKQEQKG